MRKNLQFVLLSAFCLLMVNSIAQNKYAILVGINNYYNSPTELSQFCLKGCVNDAKSIQSLLINRFGFEKKNIISLLDKDATQTNLLNTFNAVLNQCKAGDALLFYYCGHGIWMYNEGNENDPIKQGFNQAICLSNLYAENHDCLVRDNTLKRIFNQFVDKKVVVTSLFDCCFSGNLAMDMLINRHNNYYDPMSEVSFSGKSIPFIIPSFTLRSFNPSVTLTIDDTANIPRPSERKESRFVQFSACADNEKAMEIYDEASLPHGAFTKALLSVYKSHPANLPLAQVFAEIKTELKTKQLFPQQPAVHLDSTRLNNNLIGVSANGFKDEITVMCIDKKRDTIVLNAGYADGLMNENILTNKQSKIKIVKTDADTALAVATTSGALIKPNDVFTLTDSYTSSPPLLKVYIPQSRYSSATIADFFNQKIYPFTKEKGYKDYNNWDVGEVAFIYVLIDTIMKAAYVKLLREQPAFYIFLPMPFNVAEAVKEQLGRNQNIQLVASEKEADYVLYLNYAKATSEQKKGFVFTCSPAITTDDKPVDVHMFYSCNTQVPSLQFTKTGLRQLSEKINQFMLPLLRATGTRWLNNYAKR